MSAAQRRSLHVNSLSAYWEGKDDLFSKRELAVLGAVRRAFRARATDREVMIALGFTDMNSVRPRITELVKDGLLVEDGSETDPITGKTVRVVALVYPKAQERQTEFANTSASFCFGGES